MTMQLKGPRIYLRHMTKEDIDLIVNWRNQKDVRDYFIYQETFTREGQIKWIEEQIKPGHVVQFIVCENDTNRPIGCTYLRDIDHTHKKAEYGVFIGETEMRGKGLGKEMLQLTVQYAFQTLGLHKVFARALADNQASIQCFLSGGFEKEAYLKEDVCINGKYRDVVLLAILNQTRG